MSKKRNNRDLRVAYGFSGRIQDELETYQGFREVADEEGWQVWVLHERFEMQLRNLLEKGVVDAVVGDFISLRWLRSLPKPLAAVHRGAYPLDPEVFSVSPDPGKAMQQVRKHFEVMGYPEIFTLGPRRVEGMPWLRNTAALRGVLEGKEAAGVFCASDYLARQGIQLARSLGKPVPEAFGFVGMGDRRLDSLLAELEITSVPEPLRESGRQAGELLRSRLAGEPPRQLRIAPGLLIPRESSRRRPEVLPLRLRLDEFLLPRLADPPPVADWARRAGMSRRAFEIAFARENGCTPYVYFLDLRTREAQRLLRETDWTVSRIGEAVGIPDPPRFSAFFRRQTGYTPSAWRQLRLSPAIL